MKELKDNTGDYVRNALKLKTTIKAIERAFEQMQERKEYIYKMNNTDLKEPKKPKANIKIAIGLVVELCIYVFMLLISAWIICKPECYNQKAVLIGVLLFLSILLILVLIYVFINFKIDRKNKMQYLFELKKYNDEQTTKKMYEIALKEYDDEFLKNEKKITKIFTSLHFNQLNLLQRLLPDETMQKLLDYVVEKEDIEEQTKQITSIFSTGKISETLLQTYNEKIEKQTDEVLKLLDE